LRASKQAALALSVIVLLPFAAATVAAQPPFGFRRISADEFRSVNTTVSATASALPTSQTSPPPVIYESRTTARRLPLMHPSTSNPKPVSVGKAVQKASVSVFHFTGRSVRGTATWYCKAGRSICMFKYPDRGGVNDYYAAAGPALRVGAWRGRVVHVCGRSACINVKLVDWCACHKGYANERVIDLYWDAFNAVSPGSGGETVRITW